MIGVTGRTDMIIFKPLHLSKWKESLTYTPGFSPGIISESFLHEQALGVLQRDRIIPHSEEGMTIPSV